MAQNFAYFVRYLQIIEVTDVGYVFKLIVYKLIQLTILINVLEIKE